METVTLVREKVYDPVLRGLHAWNGLLILLLIATAQARDYLAFAWPTMALRTVHLWLGYGLLLGLLGRIAWGVIGPRHDRWIAMWQPRAWRQAWADRRWFTPPEMPGHHPLASAAYLLVYLLMLAMGITGLALAAITMDTGPLVSWLGWDVAHKRLFRQPHEIGQYVLMAYVVVHIAALIRHERVHGLPMAQAMVSGYQYFRRKP